MRISNEERITILKARIENFKASIQDKNTFDHSIYDSNTPKQDRIRAWALALEQLHDLGSYTLPIDTISAHIGQQLKEMGLDKAVAYSRQILSYKYKDSSKIHAERLLSYEFNEIREVQLREKHNKEELNHRLNQTYIDRLLDDAKLFTDFAKTLEKEIFVEKIDPYELDEYYTAKDQMLLLIREEMDKRDKVLPEKLHLLLHGYAEGTKNFAFSKYLEYTRDIIKISSKQAVRLLTGRVSKVEKLYDPQNMMEARQIGFRGTPCDECGSFRVDLKYNSDIAENKLFCYECRKWGDVITLKLENKLI